MRENSKVHLYFCVTNDVSYDQRIQKISQALLESGYAVTIVGRKLEKHYDDEALKGLMIKRLNCFFRVGPAFYLEYNFRLFFLLLSARKYNGICACDPDTLLASSCAAVLRSKVLIYDSHEYFTEVPELAQSPLKKFIWTQIESFGARKAQLRYSVGPALAYILSQKYHVPFEVIRNVSSMILEDENFDRKNIIIYQGVLNIGRGLDVAIDAMRLLPDYELWICGDGDVSLELKFQASLSKIDNVKFFGKLLPENLKFVTRQAKYGLNLLDQSSLNYYYSLANKFFDYSTYGVITINMDFPEYSTLQQAYPCAILIHSLNKDTLANAIQNDSSWQEKSKIAKNMVLDINWESEKIHLIDLYSKVFPDVESNKSVK